ncbi:MAG: hypothetical protein AB7O96_15605 [Pseudobdellovibrionaceae bacterium]
MFQKAFDFILSKPELRDRPIVLNGVSRGGRVGAIAGQSFP